MEHLTDRQLEHWLKSEDDFDRDKAAYISDHLESCHHCQEKLAKLRSYYRDIAKETQKDPGRKERSLASKIYRRESGKALPGASSLQVSQKLSESSPDSLPVQIKKHPVASATIAAGTILAAALLLLVLPWQDVNMNPTYAEVERNVLQVYNESGESIWSTVADGMPNKANSVSDSERYIRIADIDGDNMNEVLITGSRDEGEFTENILYCYGSDGTLLWKQHPPESIMFGERTHSKMITWDVTDFFVVNQPDDKPQLFVTAKSSWFPSVLYELDTNNGDLLQAYWHPGWIWTSKTYQENGRTFILLGATNNTYQKAALAVLSPDNIDGHAPLTESYEPGRTTRGNELQYIMFKPSILTQIDSEYQYNRLSDIQITSGGGLLVRAGEKWHSSNVSTPIFYTLSRNFKVLEAHGSARFETAYAHLLEEGIINNALTPEYWEALKDSVLYWDKSTSEFVKHRQLEE